MNTSEKKERKKAIRNVTDNLSSEKIMITKNERKKNIINTGLQLLI